MALSLSPMPFGSLLSSFIIAGSSRVLLPFLPTGCQVCSSRAASASCLALAAVSASYHASLCLTAHFLLFRLPSITFFTQKSLFSTHFPRKNHFHKRLRNIFFAWKCIFFLHISIIIVNFAAQFDNLCP